MSAWDVFKEANAITKTQDYNPKPMKPEPQGERMWEVQLRMNDWGTIVGILEWHLKDHPAESDVDAIIEQIFRQLGQSRR